MKFLWAVMAAIVFPSAAHAQADSLWRSWNQPVEPFRIAGNVYYVGASDITSYLITDPGGHILIDAGFVETVPQIISNIRKLGFNPRDVKALLSTQAHNDHAGGFAELKRATGASLLASKADALLLESGGRKDPHFGPEFQFEPVIVDSLLSHRDTVRVGGTRLVANITPGHTKGCTSWTYRTRHGSRDVDVLFHCSSSVPGYNLIGNKAYPEIVEDYRRSFRILEELRCDVGLSAHGSLFQLNQRAERLRGGDTDAFIDPAACRTMIESAKRNFERELARQQALH